MLVVGENEEKDGTISVRRRGEGDLGVMKLKISLLILKNSKNRI
jgi:threonyl-tRNA synthetase